MSRFFHKLSDEQREQIRLIVEEGTGPVQIVHDSSTIFEDTVGSQYIGYYGVGFGVELVLAMLLACPAVSFAKCLGVLVALREHCSHVPWASSLVTLVIVKQFQDSLASFRSRQAFHSNLKEEMYRNMNILLIFMRHLYLDGVLEASILVRCAHSLIGGIVVKGSSPLGGETTHTSLDAQIPPREEIIFACNFLRDLRNQPVLEVARPRLRYLARAKTHEGEFAYGKLLRDELKAVAMGGSRGWVPKPGRDWGDWTDAEDSEEDLGPCCASWADVGASQVE